LPVLVLTGCVLLSGVYGLVIQAECDDAYIYYVYVQNLAAGKGLTFNGQRVEGFSSAVWVVLLSAFHLLLAVPLPLLGKILSGVSGVLVILTTWLLARRVLKDRVLALLPPVLLAVTGDFAFYLYSGLEQLLFTALVTGILALWIRYPAREFLRCRWIPLLFALMILTRPEGMVLLVLILGYLTGRRMSGRALARWTGSVILWLLPAVVLRWLYYGHWLPNTFYAKSNAGLANIPHGLSYLGHSLPRYGLVLLLLLFLTGWYRIRRKGSPPSALLWIFPVVWIFYLAVQGGDNMVGGRMILPILPAVTVLLVRMLETLKTGFPALTAVLLVAVIGLAFGYVADARVSRHRQSWEKTSVIRLKIGRYLNRHYPSNTLVALNPAGIIPFYSKLPAIDMLGLNDVHIARRGRRDRGLPFGHQAGDGNYVLSRRPDIILFKGGDSPTPGIYISDREIWRSPLFWQRYRRVYWAAIGTHAYVLRSGSPMEGRPD